MGNAGGAKSRRPLAVTELLQVDVAASSGREQERRVQTRGDGIERVLDALA
jgi:hypothetical protein